ncbi:MAG: response regulator transcription factor [Clostridiales bacterium]|nr:response regulator transcription factor [Clostridiales bacterium]
MRNRILVVDDNPDLREVISIFLGGEGYDVVTASDGPEALSIVDDTIDLIILDVMMPGMSGYKVCAQLRESTMAPVLFLTAKTQDSDKAMGFSSGGDDYLSKPFSYNELLARVKALLRRYYVYNGKNKEYDKYITVYDLLINTEFNEVKKGENEIILTDIEYRILLLLASHKKKIFSPQNIYESIWDEPYFYSANNTVMVHIRKLRTKIEDNPQSPKYVKTVWGKGYRVE